VLPLIPAAVLTAATLLLATLWRLALLALRRPAAGFWGRTLRWHLGLLVVHLFVTVPVALGIALPHLAGTRPDESGYGGPRLAADGTWQLQSRESLQAETGEPGEGDAGAACEESPFAVSFVAEDGVRLRGFLVPPAEAAHAPRFVAVLVHGLFRGALELETPASMLRDLGGEVLLVELRSHGGSQRARLTLGRDEALDVEAAVAFLRGRPGAEARPLVVFAVSLGTAAAALAAPRIDGLDGLVLDAPMDDAASTARRVLGAGGPWSSIREPWATTLLLSARFGAGRDRRMPPENVRALYEALPTPPERKRLWVEPGASHGKVWVSAPGEYRRHLAWLVERAAGPAAHDAGGAETGGE
jgi:dienelactone hydrolase